MLQKKVCMLGAFSVGKTSLVRRFVSNVFSDKYLTTIGVKIDRKVVSVEDREISLLLWDIQGEDQFARILPTYLRGASGCLLVADGTRKDTVDVALDLAERVVATVGEVPSLLIINKADLENDWALGEDDIESLQQQGWSVIETSAKHGRGVESAFLTLADRMLRG
jgi:small GTP-binding protein